MLFKETSLDPNVAAIPEKHLFSTWSCKPGKYYTALPHSTGFFGAKVLTNVNAKQVFSLSCALKYLSKGMLFASNRSALSEKRLSSRLEIRVLHFVFIQGNDTTPILSISGFGEARIIFLLSSENDLQR